MTHGKNHSESSKGNQSLARTKDATFIYQKNAGRDREGASICYHAREIHAHRAICNIGGRAVGAVYAGVIPSGYDDQRTAWVRS